MTTIPALCFSCAFYNKREKTCARFIVSPPKQNGEPNFEKVASVRLDSHRCGPEGKLYITKFNLNFLKNDSFKIIELMYSDEKLGDGF